MLRILLSTLAIVTFGTRAQATIVQFDTVLGSFSVRLFDGATPLSTQNFLNYVNDGDFIDSIVHRSIPGFIVQSGGFTYTLDGVGNVAIPTDAPVVNEPNISNIRGTLAYAKQGGNPNSATSGWFANLSNNTANLDNQNGGFTVFATVLGDGMDVLDAIAEIPIFNGTPLNSAFGNLPLQNFSGGFPLKENYILVNSVTVVNLADGDYTFDGAVDAQDLAVWSKDFGRLNLVGGDYNDDKEINGADFLQWQQGFGKVGAAYTDGDSDGNGSINADDLLVWDQGFGSTLDVSADGNGTASIDGADFLLWQRDFETAPTLAAAGIPEPGSIALVSATCLFVLLRDFRRRRR